MHTFACAQRLFNILDEVPAVKEVAGEENLNTDSISIENVDFKYDGRSENLLKI